jgi:hypothetical protein
MKKAVLFFLFLFAISSGAFATGDIKKVISGKVVDTESHESLAGVKVSVEGTNISTYTDINGKYTLFIPQGTDTKISFSLVSYRDNVIPGSNASVNGEINLESSN